MKNFTLGISPLTSKEVVWSSVLDTVCVGRRYWILLHPLRVRYNPILWSQVKTFRLCFGSLCSKNDYQE